MTASDGKRTAFLGIRFVGEEGEGLRAAAEAVNPHKDGCPNYLCGHIGYSHDINDEGDPIPMCAVGGCRCGHPPTGWERELTDYTVMWREGETVPAGEFVQTRTSDLLPTASDMGTSWVNVDHGDLVKVIRHLPRNTFNPTNADPAVWVPGLGAELTATAVPIRALAAADVVAVLPQGAYRDAAVGYYRDELRARGFSMPDDPAQREIHLHVLELTATGHLKLTATAETPDQAPSTEDCG